MKKFIAAKLHGIRVTDANLNYHGSITLDPEVCEQIGILPLEYVDIWNKNSGARISTYVIYGDRNSKCCILNGAASRTCQVGDELIIASSSYLDDLSKLKNPKVAVFDQNNNISEILEYDILKNADYYSFSIKCIK